MWLPVVFLDLKLSWLRIPCKPAFAKRIIAVVRCRVLGDFSTSYRKSRRSDFVRISSVPVTHRALLFHGVFWSSAALYRIACECIDIDAKRAGGGKTVNFPVPNLTFAMLSHCQHAFHEPPQGSSTLRNLAAGA